MFKYTIKNIRLNVIKYDKEKKQEDVTILKAEICQKKLSISYRVRPLESRSSSETAQPKPASVFCVLVWHFHDCYSDTQYIIES